MQIEQHRRIGRPKLSERGSVQISIRFPKEIIDGIDDIVARRYGQAERTSVIRELVADALARKRP